MIYNRRTKNIEPEKIYKTGAMRFYYKTTFGGLCRAFVRLPVVSKICGFFQKSKRSKRKIEKFIKDYDIDMNGFENSYNSFNDFFIRKRAQENFDKNAGHLISPADSCVLARPIAQGVMYSIKGRDYTLSRFLKDEGLAREYEGGICLIFRLRVYDYHRFCFVDDGMVESRKRIKGFLDSVNTNATGKFALSSNYREISRLKTVNFGDIIVAEVGAMLVGHIVRIHKDRDFLRGVENGYFEFGGSTIVMLLKKDTVQIDEDITGYSLKGVETKVGLGERIGTRIG